MTYLISVNLIKKLIANKRFEYLARNMMETFPGGKEWEIFYDQMDELLKSLGIDSTKEEVDLFKPDGTVMYSNAFKKDAIIAAPNYNMRPEIFLAVSNAYGNPITNSTLYPKNLESSIKEGFTFAMRQSSTLSKPKQYVAYTKYPNDTPLSLQMYTIRVVQDRPSR